jgi:undecaprenyl phosphate-alpha-L-ara4N flippase subunit ArnE
MLKSTIFLGAAVVFNVIVSLLFKQSSRADKNSALIILVGALLLSAVTALCYAKSLAKINLSVAYPIFAAGSIILICIASSWVFRETVSIRQALGMVVIIGGMVLVCAK